MPESEPLADEIPEAETVEVAKFGRSLLELKDLRSQLHHAANFCEKTFLNAAEKRAVVESTKEYICRAVVTVVDHLGSVSSNLECRLSKTNAFCDTELRIDSLKQRLLHANNTLTNSLSRDTAATKDLQSINKISRELGGPTAATAKTLQFLPDEEVPLFLYTCNCKPSLFENSKFENSSEKRSSSPAPVLPVRSGLTTTPNPQHRYFQFQDSPKLKNSILNRKFKVQNKDLMSLVRRGKRALT